MSRLTTTKISIIIVSAGDRTGLDFTEQNQILFSKVMQLFDLRDNCLEKLDSQERHIFIWPNSTLGGGGKPSLKDFCRKQSVKIASHHLHEIRIASGESKRLVQELKKKKKED
jgi:hypothetical protein